MVQSLSMVGETCAGKLLPSSLLSTTPPFPRPGKLPTATVAPAGFGQAPQTQAGYRTVPQTQAGFVQPPQAPAGFAQAPHPSLYQMQGMPTASPVSIFR